MELKFNRKGQAAVTDSLFFLIIIVGLSTFLFTVVSGYGSSLSTQLSQQYSTEFVSSTLKTILYSSTPRDPSELLTAETGEIDYLLAMVKEDFFDDTVLRDDTKIVLGENVVAAMRPVSPTHDFIFYMYNQNDTDFVFLMIKRTYAEYDSDGILDPNSVETMYYFCDEPFPPPPNYNAKTILATLVARAGEVFSSSNNLVFNTDGSGKKTITTSLALWSSTD
ncbi:MAG: hypothetical protein ABH821_05915, partial [archaeon]